jgi:aryl-alcohol dehydrogenase-like predicted oxidoreductase
VQRVEAIRQTVGDEEPNLATAALKFALKPAAVSVVIPGIRSVAQAEMNLAVGSSPPLGPALEERLRPHGWRRGFWYLGK